MTEKISDKYPNLFKACRQYPEITLEIQRNSKKCKERKLSIMYLKGMKEKYIEGEGYERHPLSEYYAIENAIKALEQQSCEDCVSRNAIIQTLNNMDRYVASELILCDTNNKFPQNEVFIVDDVYEQITEQLPSVTPKPKTGYWVLADEQNKEDVENDNYRFICSECQCSDIHSKGTKVSYCWKCGAKMIEQQESEE